MKRRLVTSALPYVNNVPHLGNLIQVLSADVFARACRLRGYETLYVCGTDEYGTATETKAAEEGVSPAELCARFHDIHKAIYEWFGISFDKFGRTSTPRQTEIVQSLFKDIDAAGLVSEQTIEQLYCDPCARFLADRYVRGTCPHCGYADARGDQCEACGKLLEPTELKEPKCSTCAATPRLRSTKHLYIDLPAIKPRLESWMKEASVKGFWANNAIQMTQAWIRDGLKARAITRDLKWGIPVPKPGFEDKVFYVWFDAPIGYLSITACAGDERGFDWKSWWMSPDDVELYQFIGKDNIPFHTVIFPSTLLGSGRDWTMLHHMSSTEYLNYESGKFSKSKGIGVFGTDVMETGIPADVWRFYIFYNRPEKSDVTFTWSDFLERVNGELIGNLGNLANRTLAFVQRFYDGVIPAGKPNDAFWAEVKALEAEVAERFERADLRDAFRTAFQIADIANKRFQAEEPWKARTADPDKAASLLSDLCYVLRDLAIIMHPYMPAAMSQLAGFFGLSVSSGSDTSGLSWADVSRMEGLSTISDVGVLFQKLDPDRVAELREKYAGSQKERAERDAAREAGVSDDKMAKPAQPAAEKKTAEPKPAPYAELPVEERFARLIDLRVAKIVKIERHPKADKLYIETLDDGSGEERVIVSGLVPFYEEEELLGRHIVLVNNLKPAKLRGVESRGMLLAASKSGTEGKEIVEVLDAPWAVPGTRVTLEGQDPAVQPDAEIDVDAFFSVPIAAKGFGPFVGTRPLVAEGKAFTLTKVSDGEVG
ncbi:MAG: methionine--tRNA ligase [Spirochaetae bacterium HGW-Spirochaetae-3]|jgi:methionyl-tRNA synthetase|nr:MAG: methionine--tRNA ligase [Spirochaetae bacterium HGW-Spirochaetae-3]